MEERRRSDLASLVPELQGQLSDIEQQFTIRTDDLKRITERFEEELREGLEKHGANISMHATWVFGHPTGQEKGQYLTLDLGGTNLRVCWVTLKGEGNEVDVEESSYLLPDGVKSESADTLWDLITDSLDRFLQEHHLGGDPDHPLPLGFTFSYPADQDRIDHGKLKTWTKGFHIKGVEGRDVAAQLRDAISKKNLPIELVALVNDTTGALIASSYTDPDTIIGAIFGTGCNAAYVEDVGSIQKLKTQLPPGTPMAINCEYGAFDNSHRVLPRTKYDVDVDATSSKPGEQTFEKMSAGLYLGEILRLILLDLHDQGLVFPAQHLPRLREPYTIDTALLSALENESPTSSKAQLAEVVSAQSSEEDSIVCRHLAEVIATRGARLCTCGVAAICRMKNIRSGHVAADGSVANKHPKFKIRWANALGEILDWPADREHDPITITSAEDGSGLGAAIISAMTLQRKMDGHCT
ncbi:hexokinase-domain-containing protein [Xylariomycetidae sp. FL0641]|nr:hexokinase-domain-containing protein [Xylariomycetidae sp. FL0641]